MSKIDYRKAQKDLYNPPVRQAAAVTVPPMLFLMIDGAGDPDNSPALQAALATLYGLSYPLKFTSRKALNLDYVVMPAEGLWWVEGVAFDIDSPDRSAWRWTLMVRQPDHVTPAMLEDAKAALRRKKNPANLDEVRLEPYDEGLAAQIMHIGPYSAEKPTIDRLHAYIAEQGGTLRGKHHEIYLSDPARTAPARLKTIIRQPMAV
jgi:hypothetical protein